MTGGQILHWAIPFKRRDHTVGPLCRTRVEEFLSRSPKEFLLVAFTHPEEISIHAPRKNFYMIYYRFVSVKCEKGASSSTLPNTIGACMI